MDLPHSTDVRAVGGAFLLDVREDDEWRAGRAPDAVHVPLQTLPGRLQEIPTDRPVAVICRSGHRSAQATGWLRGQGYAATNVAGGMQAWAAAGLPMAGDGPARPHVA